MAKRTSTRKRKVSTSNGKPSEDTVSIEDLTTDAANPRLHTPRNRKALTGSLKQFGAARSIVIDADGVVRAGNGTVEAARELGITRVRIIDGDPDELIAVRRRDLKDIQAVAYAIADNKSSDLAEWDYKSLTGQLKMIKSKDLKTLDATGFADYELDPLLNAEWRPPEAADGDANKLPGGHTVKFTEEQWELMQDSLDGDGSHAEQIVRALSSNEQPASA